MVCVTNLLLNGDVLEDVYNFSVSSKDGSITVFTTNNESGWHYSGVDMKNFMFKIWKNGNESLLVYEDLKELVDDGFVVSNYIDESLIIFIIPIYKIQLFKRLSGSNHSFARLLDSTIGEGFSWEINKDRFLVGSPLHNMMKQANYSSMIGLEQFRIKGGVEDFRKLVLKYLLCYDIGNKIDFIS